MSTYIYDDNAFDKCSQVFKENSSALSGYQAPDGSLKSVYCIFDSCAYILKQNLASSGYYTMNSESGPFLSTLICKVVTVIVSEAGRD